MAYILSLETSTNVCSVALSGDGMRLFEKSDFNGPNHAVSLGVFVDEALTFADGSGVTLDAVAVSRGPGSYTGLRIGVSMAKGLCYARSLPLLAVDTLELLCVPVLLEKEIEDDALLCPMLDARRMEVYAAIYDKALHVPATHCSRYYRRGSESRGRRSSIENRGRQPRRARGRHRLRRIRGVLGKAPRIFLRTWSREM